MDNYETEEQQVEAIKKWWSENYIMVIIVSIIGLGSIVGVQQWKQSQNDKAQTASMEYDQILSVVSDTTSPDKVEQVSQQTENLQTEFSDYPYAALAAMLEAKELVNAGKMTDAQNKYQWIIANSKNQSLQHISRIRLATIMSAQDQHEEALKLLEVEQGSFKASYLEVKGDILVALNRINEARAAYNQALQAYAAIGANAQILKVKRNDLGNS